MNLGIGERFSGINQQLYAEAEELLKSVRHCSDVYPTVVEIPRGSEERQILENYLTKFQITFSPHSTLSLAHLFRVGKDTAEYWGFGLDVEANYFYRDKTLSREHISKVVLEVDPNSPKIIGISIRKVGSLMLRGARTFRGDAESLALTTSLARLICAST